MNFRREIKLKDRAPIATWLGDSQIWMATAVENGRASGRGRGGDATNHHALNVAHVCVGLAFELVLKALARARGVQWSRSMIRRAAIAR